MNAATKIPPANVYQRLNQARKVFHETKLAKTGKNTFANYSYFELGDFLVPALRIFDDCGLCGRISFTGELATMRIVNVDDPSDFDEITSPMGSAALKGCHEVQNIGAVETYQRRYLWAAALEIVEHDALDATTGNTAAQGQRNSTVSPAQPEQAFVDDATVTKIIALCEAVGGGQTQIICKAYKVDAIPELTPKQGQAVIARLNEKLAEKAKSETNAIADDLGDSIPY